jgi:hypothetical protein
LPISPIFKDVIIQKDKSIGNHDIHTCYSPNASLISDEGVLVKEDTIIENHEGLSCPSLPSPWEDIMPQEDEIIERFLNITLLSIHSSLKNSPTRGNYLVKEDEIMDNHEKIIIWC